MNYIGIDLGTSSVKGLLMSETLEVVCTYSLDYPNYINSDGWSEQNPEDWYEQSKLVIEYLIQKSDKQIKSISFSGQMHGLVILDENDKIIRNAILWNDQRTTSQCQYLNTEIGTENLINWTGNIALTGFTAPKILWLKESEPDNFSKIHKIMLPKDYLAYCLSGVFATDFSDASGTLYLDVENKCWSENMLSVLNISEEQLPHLYNSYDVIGQLNADFKKQINIGYDIEIVIGGGDQAVSAIGTGTVNVGDISISLGTSGALFAPLKQYIKDSNGILHTFCDASGKYHKMGVALCSAGSVQWWTRQIIEDQDFEKLEANMAKVNPKEEIYFLPHLIGERSVYNDSNVRGAFVGLSLHHTKADMSRSVLEGVAFSLKQIADEMNLELDSNIKITGGGAKNKLWLQIISDVFAMPIKQIDAVEGPAYGAALLALAATSDRSICDLANQALSVTQVIKPSADAKVYAQKYKQWLKLYPAIKQL